MKIYVTSQAGETNYVAEANVSVTALFLNNEKVISVSEGGSEECEILVTIPGLPSIVLSSEQAEYLTAALVAHQNVAMAMEITIEEEAA